VNYSGSKRTARCAIVFYAYYIFNWSWRIK